MIELQAVVGIVALFIMRVGIPLALLVGLGVLIDRWQQKRAEEVEEYRQQNMT